MLTPAIVEVSITTSGTFVVSNGFTFTVHVATFPPSCVVTVIIASPPCFAVITPLLTVTLLLSLLLHVTFLFIAFSGVIVAVKVCVVPLAIVMLLLFSITPWTASPTVTLQLAVWFPSWVVTVIIAVPAFTAVTTPLFTVAIVSSLLLHVTALLGEFPWYYCCCKCFCFSYF